MSAAASGKEQAQLAAGTESELDNVNLTRVLLVDDHALVRAGVRALVSGMENVLVVGEAGNGKEALSLIESACPDLILLDITMPEMNGLVTLEEIKKRFPTVRVIMLTMHEAREYVIQSLRAGAAGFIPKSAASTELKQAIDAVMRGRTYVSAETSQDDLTRVDTGAREQSLLERLTPRQREILVMIAEGKTTKQIARALEISVKTVESHRAQLTERLNIREVAGLVRFAIQTNLIKME